MSDPKLTNFVYAPTLVGFDNRFWRSTSGTPTVTGNRIRLNADAAYSYPQFRYGIFEFGVIIPTAPTAGDDRKWGFQLPEMVGRGSILFQIGGATFTATSYNNDGTVSDSQTIVWDAAWTNTETKFTLVWYANGCRCSINDTDAIMLKVPKQVGDMPMALYLDNQNADNMEFTYIMVKECESVIDPRSIGVGLSGEFQYDSDSWTQAIGVNVDVAAVRPNLFNKVAVGRNVQMTVSDTITVRFNSATAPAITVRPNTRANWNNVYVTNLFITTSASTDIDVYIQANPL